MFHRGIDCRSDTTAHVLAALLGVAYRDNRGWLNSTVHPRAFTMKNRILISLALSTVLLGAQSPSVLAQKTPAAAATAPAAAAKAAPAVKAAAADSDSGKAAYYSRVFNGRKTASGERFDNSAMVTAHRSLPFGTKLRVTNTKNKKSVIVRVIDRGPSQPDRIVDLSRAAATKLGFVKAGMTDVTIQVVGKDSTKATMHGAKKRS
jgi:rare lipoprotein A